MDQIPYIALGLLPVILLYSGARLFVWMRRMLAQLAEAASARIASEDRERLWRSRSEVAESERDKAKASLENSLKQIANYQAMQMGSFNVPFPEIFVAPRQQEAQTEHPGAPQRRQAREVQAEQVSRTRQEAIARLREVQDQDSQARN